MIFPRLAILAIISMFIFGCVGSPVHETITYASLQSTIKSNNGNLLKLRVGMTKEEVGKTMGNPERSEGYKWGIAWLYRTAMTSGIYGTADSDFTPIVFDSQNVLL